MKSGPRSASWVIGSPFRQEVCDLSVQQESSLPNVISLFGDPSKFTKVAKVTVDQRSYTPLISFPPLRDELADRFQICSVSLQAVINTAQAVVELLFRYGTDVVPSRKTLQILIPLLRGSCSLL